MGGDEKSVNDALSYDDRYALYVFGAARSELPPALPVIPPTP